MITQEYWLDLAIIAVIALSMITGFFRGFIKEVIALCIWIIAIFLAYNYSSNLHPWLSSYIHDKTAVTATAFVIVLLGTLIVGGIVNALIGALLRHSGLSGTDRLLGLGFGMARGIFIIALLMAVVKMIGIPTDEYTKNSKLYSKFDPLVNYICSKLPSLIEKAKTSEAVRQSLVDFQLKQEEQS